MPTTIDNRCDKIANDLLDAIRPYYKSLRRPGERPDFRKCLKSSEVEDILNTVHDVIVELKLYESEDSLENVQ